MGQKHETSDARPPKRRRLVRIALWCGAVFVVLVALGPMLAGPLARPFVEGSINDKIRGHANLTSLRLSWFGEQRVALTLDDPDGGRVADASVRVDRGLLGMVFGSRRLGVVTIRGSATIIRAADGSTNLQRAIESQFPTPDTGAGPGAGSGTGKAATLPRSLAASVVLDGFEVLFQDAALWAQTDGTIGAIRLGTLTGSLDFAVGSPMGVMVSGPIATGSESSALAESGSLNLHAQITGLTDAAGTLTPDALGAELTFSLAVPALDAVLHAGLSDGVLTRTDESRVTLNISELASIMPKVAKALANQPGVEVSQLPTVTLVLDALRVPIDGDLRTASATLRLTTTPIAGSVEVLPGETPAPQGEVVPKTPFSIEPFELVLTTESLSDTVALTGGTRANIGDASAGTLTIDLALGGVLDEAGGIRTGVPGMIAGGVRVEGFATPILQPFVAAFNTTLPAGLRADLTQDLGPTVDLSLDAVSHTNSSGAYDITIALDAEHAQLEAALVVNGQKIASRGEGVRADFTSVAPMLDRLTAAHGVRVKSGGRFTMQIAEFAVDLATLTTPAGLDLRGIHAAFDLAIIDAVGQVRLAEDDSLRDFRLERLTLGMATDDLDGEIRITSDASGRLNGNPFASMNADITLTGLLDDAGAPQQGTLPSFRGEVRIDSLALNTIDALFGSLYADTGITLVKDIGTNADLLLLAVSNPAVGPEATDLDLTFRSSAVDITAPLLLTPDRVRSRGPITLVDRAAGRTLGALMGSERPVRITPTGTVRLVVSGLDVPIAPGAFRPDRLSANLTATLSDFATNLVIPGPNGEPGQVQRLDIPEFEARVVALSGKAPRVEATGDFLYARQAFSLTLTSTLHGFFLDTPRDPADPMSVLAVGSTRPEMTLSLTDLPATLARIVPQGLVMIGDQPLDAVLLSRDTLGRTVDVTIETFPNPQVSDATRFVVALRGQGTRVDLAGAIAPRRFRLDRAEIGLGVTPRVASHLVGLFAADAPVQPRLTKPAQVGLALNKPFEVRFADAGELDIAKLGGVLDARLTLDAALAAMTLPAAEDAEPMTIPPVHLRGLVLSIAAPLGVLGDEGGDVTATITGNLIAADGSPLATLAGSAQTTVKDSKPQGSMPVSLTLGDVASPWIDELLGKPSLIAGALGETFSITIDAYPDRFQSRVVPKPALSLMIESPRFTSNEPIAFAVNTQAIYLHKAVNATWVMGPRWANLYFLGAKPGGKQPSFSFTKQTRVELDINRVALSLSEGVGLFKPGIFVLNVTATIPDLASKLGGGREMQLGDVSLRLTRGPTPDQIGFALSVPRMKVGNTPEVKPDKSTIFGRVAAFADADGNLTPDTIRLNVSGGLSPIPTEVLDAFARLDGLLPDLLGPTVDFSLNAEEFSMQGGSLRAQAVTPLASLDITGMVDDRLFIINPTASLIEVNKVTPELAYRFQKAMPVVATLEKTRDDKPMRVIFETPLELPLDGNMDRLNGVVTLDIGTARFGTSDLFEKVLVMAQQKSAGQVGRRLPPMKITMDDGLISYDTYALPFGEFTLETQGVLNLSSKPRQIGTGGKSLPSKQLQVLTFIPAGAFAAEAIPGLANIPLPIIGNLARLPIRTSGLIAKPQNDIAVDLVGQEAVNELIGPGKLLENLLGGDK